MKYYVRTTLDRKLDKSYSKIEYELLIDKEHDAKKSFYEQIERLAELNEDCVILEDDLVLCRDFKRRIEKVIKANSHSVISFFYQPFHYFETKYLSDFMWNQCTYYPKELLTLLAKELRETQNRMKDIDHDVVEGVIFRKHFIKFLAYRPCLVQHLDLNTLIHRQCKQIYRTPYFIDYLEDLGIDYKDAESHRQELIDYRDKCFKKYV